MRMREFNAQLVRFLSQTLTRGLLACPRVGQARPIRRRLIIDPAPAAGTSGQVCGVLVDEKEIRHGRLGLSVVCEFPPRLLATVPMTPAGHITRRGVERRPGAAPTQQGAPTCGASRRPSLPSLCPTGLSPRACYQAAPAYYGGYLMGKPGITRRVSRTGLTAGYHRVDCLSSTHLPE